MKPYINKKVISTTVLAVVAASALTGCEPSDEEKEASFRNDIVTSMTLENVNKEKDVAYKLLTELRKTDPRIEAVEPVISNGEHTVSVSRAKEDGTFEVWTMDPKAYRSMIAEATPKQQEAKSNDFNMGGALAGAAVGMMAGALMGNMFRNSGTTSSFTSRGSYDAYNHTNRQGYSQSMMQSSNRFFDNEREKERRGGGGYVSPAIQSTANRVAASQGPSAKSGGASSGYRAPTSSYSSAGRSSSSSQAFSSSGGGRASVSSGG